MDTAAAAQLAEAPAQAEAARAIALSVDTAPLDPLNGIPRALVARAESKAEIVAAFGVFEGRSCRTLGATLESFVAEYNRGEIEVSAGTREMFAEISGPSLQRDWRRFEKSGIAGLIPGYGKRRGDSIIARNPAMREFVIASILHNPRVNTAWLLAGIKARFLDAPEIPSAVSLWRYCCEWKRQNPALFMRIADPDGWKNRAMLALGDAAAGITRVNQRWEIDGTKSDAFVWTEIETKTGKMQMIGLIDIQSRRKAALLAPSESSQAVADLLIKAFGILGMPDEIVSDRGAAFLSARTQRAMIRLGIKWTAVRAYSGEKKPFIERGGMGSVLHMFFENLPGYSGHNPAEASAIRKRRSFAQRRGQNLAKLYRVELSAPELQTLLDQYLEHVDGNRRQADRIPNEVIAEAARRGQIRRVADDRLLDLLLAEDGIATVTKKGLRVKNSFYWDEANALEPFIGQRVQYVRTRDQGKVIVYSADSAPRFLCIAVDPEFLGMDRQVLAIAAKQDQRAKTNAKLEDLRRLKKTHHPETVYREIIDNAVARAAVMLPTAGEDAVSALPYRSPALTAAAEALAALDAPAEPVPHDAETLRAGDLALEEIERRHEIRDLQLSDDELDALWLAIRRDPRALTLREQRFLAHYKHSAKSWADCYETTPEFQALTLRMSAA
jgi:hypothetical protein